MYYIVNEARLFAKAAHAAVGQTRKYSGELYIAHPARVVQTLIATGYSDVNVLCAAWLHDVIEDTKVTFTDIEEEFGILTANLVLQVTNQVHAKGLSRKARKRLDREWLTKASADGQTIKLADILDNTSDIRSNDPDFAKVYIEEKKLLLPLLTKGNNVLYSKVYDQLYGV